MLKIFYSSLFVLFLFFSINSLAQEEPAEEVAEGDVPPPEPLRYFKINPNIITTYQNTGKKLKYVVVQVQVVVRGETNYDLVELHMPLLQDALTDFFNRQEKSTIEDLSQRENLRLKALERVDAVLLEELGNDIVESVIFTQYVFQ